ncbi:MULTISPECIES: hypothetical protein [Bradyrhizobium]|uniref:Uncharacterized protein n=1 Tax=Bradyrhizobium barranii subsp. barranii TaxID=2823807 RepID=A0A7Z0TSR6_9BRAD|nr:MULTISPECIES: hypothetical protein [Bradyrhizobium]MCP1766050.1 hypothetical protein [Bradyrhizobium japonicum]MCP1788187.1 hypothetical protein [Bradyrhizobium japonicum]MCP1810063.1 hypothetical protein [Bradyrhizobium japonicum]MCP1818997.1 hypothetical protein [Bradyrhizobium japonicum]MCP1869493.1 hypothetical protein [Bradyrhizobium japonicum]
MVLRYFKAMPRNTNRNLPRSADLLAAKDELLAGRRIVIASLAGPRLSGKKGIVLGQGATATQVKVLLDGAKGYVILHARYVDLFEDRSATEGV